MKAYKKVHAVLFCLAFMLFIMPADVKSQGPPPPPANDDSGSNHGSNFNQPPDEGGSAPIGSGMLILLAMGAGYGAYKYRKVKHI